jgi:hypothetical protein
VFFECLSLVLCWVIAWTIRATVVPFDVCFFRIHIPRDALFRFLWPVKHLLVLLNRLSSIFVIFFFSFLGSRTSLFASLVSVTHSRDAHDDVMPRNTSLNESSHERSEHQAPFHMSTSPASASFASTSSTAAYPNSSHATAAAAAMHAYTLPTVS